MSAAPTQGKGPAACDDRPPHITTNNDSFSDTDGDFKNFATLAALLAIRGYSLHELACGGFLIARWDRTAHCSDLGAVRGFLQRLGVLT